MFYHVALFQNKTSITRTGVDPQFSTGAQFRSWFVTREKLAWAILHTQKRHKAMIGEIIVFQCETLKKAQNSGHKGIFSTPCNNRVKYLGTADQVIGLIGEDKI